jgi:hypothetical protein
MNQCDGCRAGKPLDQNGNHAMGEPGGYRDLMACQRSKYEPPKKRWTQGANCTCYFGCGDDSWSGQWHQHEDDPCPEHPAAPMVG